MFNLISDFLIKILGSAAPFLIRRYYRPEKLAEKVKIQIRSDGEGIVYMGGELPSAKAWLQITNLSPFPVKLDRLTGNFMYGTILANYCYLEEIAVNASDEQQILITANLTSSHIDYISKHKGNREAGISIYGLFRCKINDFRKDFYELKTKNYELINFN